MFSKLTKYLRYVRDTLVAYGLTDVLLVYNCSFPTNVTTCLSTYAHEIALGGLINNYNF